MRRIAGLLTVATVLFSAVIVWAAPDRQATVFELSLVETRGDLEVLANTVYGEGIRPDEWTFNFDLTSPTYLVDLWYDNETLADQVFLGTRPAEWFGATTTNRELLARNIRHDLELSADEVYGLGERPEAWVGASPIFQCSRTLQNLDRLLQTQYEQQPTTALTVPSYCDALRFEIEGELLPVVFNQPGDVVLTPISLTEGERVLEIDELTLALRGDVERLANELLGVNTRPGAWIGSVDRASPTLAADIAADLDTLADIALDDSARPDGWGRYIPEAPVVSYLNLRFNLEALADATQGENVRPNGWQGTNPLNRCDPFDQVLVYVVTRLYGFEFDPALEASPNFCSLVAFSANNIAENPPVIEGGELVDDPNDDFFTAESQNAFAYLDVGTTQYMGIMPRGTQFRAWYRNYQQSTMMYVTGDDFGLFIDRRWTNLDPDVFARLPNLDGVRPLTYCDATWCNGPGPTPTPTGGSAILRLHQGQTTPVPQQQDPGQVAGAADKTQVSWNHIRVTYLLDRQEQGVVQVALEICQEPQLINCEPVTSVFNNDLGVQQPVISQFNGLNVYEMPYGYSDDFVVEGPTLISPDIWISDPTIR
ncbi:MAG: hypothetical protein ACOCXZ_03440 [Chloroflexota bacterium]